MTIDGHTVPNYDQFLHFSPLFTFQLPPGNVYEEAPGTYSGINYGRALMIEPLRPGSHTIVLRATFGDGTRGTRTYNITVTP